MLSLENQPNNPATNYFYSHISANSYFRTNRFLQSKSHGSWNMVNFVYFYHAHKFGQHLDIQKTSRDVAQSL